MNTFSTFKSTLVLGLMVFGAQSASAGGIEEIKQMAVAVAYDVNGRGAPEGDLNGLVNQAVDAFEGAVKEDRIPLDVARAVCFALDIHIVHEEDGAQGLQVHRDRGVLGNFGNCAMLAVNGEGLKLVLGQLIVQMLDAINMDEMVAAQKQELANLALFLCAIALVCSELCCKIMPPVEKKLGEEVEMCGKQRETRSLIPIFKCLDAPLVRSWPCQSSHICVSWQQLLAATPWPAADDADLFGLFGRILAAREQAWERTICGKTGRCLGLCALVVLQKICPRRTDSAKSKTD